MHRPVTLTSQIFRGQFQVPTFACLDLEISPWLHWSNHRSFKWYMAAIRSMIVCWTPTSVRNGKTLPCELINLFIRTSGVLSLLATIVHSFQLLRDPITRQVVENTKKEVHLERCSNMSHVLMGTIIYSWKAPLLIHDIKHLWSNHGPVLSLWNMPISRGLYSIVRLFLVH